MMRCAWRGLLSVGVPVLSVGRGSRVRGRYIQSHLRPAVFLIDPATDVQDLLLLTAYLSRAAQPHNAAPIPAQQHR